MPFVEWEVLGPPFVDALGAATTWHAKQTRKKGGSHVPYVSHLLAVAALVLEDGGTEEQAIAGLLHDSMEDVGVTAGELAARWGEEVARIVLACTDTTEATAKPPWRARKEHHLAALRQLGPDEAVLRVTAADKLHNCRDLVTDVRLEGRDRLLAFNGGIDGTCWYYASMNEIVSAGLPHSRLTLELDREVRTLIDLVRPSGSPGPPPPAT